MWCELVDDVQDSESRLDALRQRVESTGEEKVYREKDEAAAGPSRPPILVNEEVPISSSLSNSASRHINLFEDLEQVRLHNLTTSSQHSDWHAIRAFFVILLFSSPRFSPRARRRKDPSRPQKTEASRSRLRRKI